MKVLKNVKTYITGKGFKNTDIIFSNKIEGFKSKGNEEEISIPEGYMVVPGFIDEHIHGAGGAEVLDCSFEALEKVSTTLSKSGTTAYMATTTASQTVDKLEEMFAWIGKYIKTKNDVGAEVLGIHAEGPFLTKKYKGAMREDCIFEPSIEVFKKLNAASDNTIKFITLAPEAEGADDLIKYLKEQNIKVSLGHTAATYEDIKRAVELGATSITHTYNAQSPLHHREIGTVGSALLMDDLYTEIIADGIHVSVPAMKLLIKNKPKNKVILITDALRCQGLPEGRSDLSGIPINIMKDCARLLDGTLAGTVLPMNGMLKNMVEKVGVKLEDAIDFATINPATNLGIENRKGSIEKGKDADFAIINDNFEVCMTIRQGEVVYKK